MLLPDYELSVRQFITGKTQIKGYPAKAFMTNSINSEK